MVGSDVSSELVCGAIPELRSLAAAALANALGEPAVAPVNLPFLTLLLTPESRAQRAVVRRFERMNDAMPFAAFESASTLQKWVFASGVPQRVVDRAVARPHKHLVLSSTAWFEAILPTALAAPAFLAQAQMIAYRGLRRRVFFGPGGPPLQPISAVTFVVLITRSGRPHGLPLQAWVRLEEIVAQLADQPGWVGPMDRLVLDEARDGLGLTGKPAPDSPTGKLGAGTPKKGIGNVSG